MAWMRKDIQSSQKSMSIDKKLISGMSLDQDTGTLQGVDPQREDQALCFWFFVSTFTCGPAVWAFSLLVLFVLPRKAGSAWYCRSREGERTGQHVGIGT